MEEYIEAQQQVCSFAASPQGSSIPFFLKVKNPAIQLRFRAQ